MVEFMQQGTTVTSQVCCETLKELRRDIQNKMRGMLTYSVVLLHDNALPCTATCTRALLEHFNWELFDHPNTESASIPAVATLRSSLSM
jgi:hypothetical protein